MLLPWLLAPVSVPLVSLWAVVELGWDWWLQSVAASTAAPTKLQGSSTHRLPIICSSCEMKREKHICYLPVINKTKSYLKTLHFLEVKRSVLPLRHPTTKASIVYTPIILPKNNFCHGSTKSSRISLINWKTPVTVLAPFEGLPPLSSLPNPQIPTKQNKNTLQKNSMQFLLQKAIVSYLALVIIKKPQQTPKQTGKLLQGLVPS